MREASSWIVARPVHRRLTRPSRCSGPGIPGATITVPERAAWTRRPLSRRLSWACSGRAGLASRRQPWIGAIRRRRHPSPALPAPPMRSHWHPRTWGGGRFIRAESSRTADCTACRLCRTPVLAHRRW